MDWMTVLIRRLLWMVAIAAAGGAAYSWWRERSALPNPGPAEWPPLTVSEPASTEAAPTEPTAAEPTPTEPTPADPAPAGADAAEPAHDATVATASVVNALVDAPEARSTQGGDSTWILPDDDGSCPVSHPIKANDNSGIFHVPGGRFYDRTRAERCYTTPDQASADGYRQAKS